MKRSILSRTIFIFMAFIGILGISGTAYIYGTLEYSRFQQDNTDLRQQYIKRQKEKVQSRTKAAMAYVLYKKNLAEKRLKAAIKQRTYEAHDTATFIYNKHVGKKSKAEIAKLIHDALFSASWDNGQGYYFAKDMQGTELINRNNPELEGKNIWDLQDSKGVYIVRRIIEVAKTKGEGFCSYHWNKPEHPGVLLPKYSFVKYFEPLDWVIGTGKYLKDQEEKIQQEILDFFEKTKTKEDGYIFAGTYDGTLLTYPAKNQNILEITDINGIPLVKELIKTAKSGGGFVSYIMPKLGKESTTSKISNCLGIDEWQWFIGHGVHTDVFETVIQERAEKLHEKIISKIIDFVFLLLLLLLFALLFARFVARKVTFDLNAFSHFFGDAAHKSTWIPEDKIHFREFKNMAHTANKMIDERERNNIEKELLQNKLEMAHKMEAIGLMAGGVAHDLNNTLSAIINVPEFLLMKMKKDDPSRESVELILEAGKRASAIVNDMLTVGKGIVSKTSATDLTILIEQALASVEFKDLKKNFPDISIDIQFPDEKLFIDCSVPHINKLLFNLVSNGMEAISEKGQLCICLSAVTTDVAIPGYNNKVPPGNYVLLEVKDNGSGIEKNDLERIFEPFYTKKIMGRSGTGLGLTVVWNTVADHHAFIQAESSSSGTTFSIYFPRMKNLNPLHEKDVVKILKKGDNQNILIVDDEEIQHKTVSKMLEELGYRSESVRSGEEAIEFLKNNQVDLIILDMMLGAGMNGRETYQAILKNTPGQKAIVVTGYALNNDVDETLAMGAKICLHKPYLLQDLAKALQTTLE